MPPYDVELEFHRTHTLCALSIVSTDCTCSDIVGVHSDCSCSSIAKLAALHVDEAWLTVIQFSGNPFSIPLIECLRISFYRRITRRSKLLFWRLNSISEQYRHTYTNRHDQTHNHIRAQGNNPSNQEYVSHESVHMGESIPHLQKMMSVG